MSEPVVLSEIRLPSLEKTDIDVKYIPYGGRLSGYLSNPAKKTAVLKQAVTKDISAVVCCRDTARLLNHVELQEINIYN